MDDNQEYAASHPAGGVEPPFAEPGYKLRFGPGTLLVPLDVVGDYGVTSATSQEGTDRLLPVTLIEVSDG